MRLFDTGKKLEKAFTKEQFEALVAVLEKRDGSLATSQELADVKFELKGDIAAVKSELKGEIAATKHELLKWFIGMLVAQTGVLVALYAIVR